MRYPTEYAVASTVKADRCCGRSLMYPGLEKRWVTLGARFDRLATFFEGVVVIICCCAVAILMGEII